MLGDGLDTRDAEHDGLQLKACALEAMRFEPEHAPGDWRAASCVCSVCCSEIQRRRFQMFPK